MIEQFHRPKTVREALALKARYRNRSAFLAGGTYLNSNESADPPAHCISLAALPLDRIKLDPARFTIGALCTLQQIVDDHKLPQALKDAALQVVSRNVRNMATIGGHVALNPPYSDLLPMLFALDAKVGVAARGATKLLPIADYIAKPTPGLITGIVVPKPAPRRVFACRNFRVSANAHSLVAAAVSLSISAKGVMDPIIAVGGVSPHVVRLPAVEKALDGRLLPPSDEVQALVSRSVRVPRNGRSAPAGSADLIKHEAGAVIALALEVACRKMGGGR
jgi:putative selenate reductase FAD-binding subunit